MVEHRKVVPGKERPFFFPLRKIISEILIFLLTNVREYGIIYMVGEGSGNEGMGLERLGKELTMRAVSREFAYEKFTGEKHVFESTWVSEGEKWNDGHWFLTLDGAFLTTAETGAEVEEEIKDAIKWFGWVRTNPNYQ